MLNKVNGPRPNETAAAAVSMHSESTVPTERIRSGQDGEVDDAALAVPDSGPFILRRQRRTQRHRCHLQSKRLRARLAASAPRAVLRCFPIVRGTQQGVLSVIRQISVE